jgi:hypothetical protein
MFGSLCGVVCERTGIRSYTISLRIHAWLKVSLQQSEQANREYHNGLLFHNIRALKVPEKVMQWYHFTAEFLTIGTTHLLHTNRLVCLCI